MYIQLASCTECACMSVLINALINCYYFDLLAFFLAPLHKPNETDLLHCYQFAVNFFKFFFSLFLSFSLSFSLSVQVQSMRLNIRIFGEFGLNFLLVVSFFPYLSLSKKKVAVEVKEINNFLIFCDTSFFIFY